jgi:hypothetical protein
MSDPRITLPPSISKPLFTGQVAKASTALYDNKTLRRGIQTELLFGQTFTVYAQSRLWVWGQAHSLIRGSARKGYIGYISRKNLTHTGETVTHKVTALRAPVFTQSNIKSFIRYHLPMNAHIPVVEDMGDFVQIDDGHYCHKRHIEKIDVYTDLDFVSVAERFLGAPYVWGGTGHMGLDCSGLVQMALCAVGVDAPRDADMQESDLGVTVNGDLKRGDLVFWSGHVGIMSDAKTLLHANAYHMETTKEPIQEAFNRIGKARTVKRFS